MTTGKLTAAAMAHKAERGEYTGGKVPFGWTLADDGITLEAVESEQRTIHSARKLREAGLSLRKVGERLAADGMLPRRGTKWAPQQVKALLAARVAS